jgi:hypothetical protein
MAADGNPQETPEIVAEQALKEADGGWVQAAKLMGKRVRTDVALRDQLMEPLVDAAVWEAIRKVARRLGHKGPQPQAAGGDSADDLRAQIARQNEERSRTASDERQQHLRAMGTRRGRQRPTRASP